MCTPKPTKDWMKVIRRHHQPPYAIHDANWQNVHITRKMHSGALSHVRLALDSELYVVQFGWCVNEFNVCFISFIAKCCDVSLSPPKTKKCAFPISNKYYSFPTDYKNTRTQLAHQFPPASTHCIMSSCAYIATCRDTCMHRFRSHAAQTHTVAAIIIISRIVLFLLPPLYSVIVYTV